MRYLNCPPPPEDIRPRCSECGALLSDDIGMCDACKNELEDIMEDLMFELDSYKKKYHNLTGDYFKRPLRLKEKK